MSLQESESLASRYVGAAGQSSDGRYQIDITQFAWLVDHCTRLGESRLELLRALQSSLPGSEEPGIVDEFKELLTNLIIMETRVSDRNERLSELLEQLANAQALDRVPVDQSVVAHAIRAIIDAIGHLKAVAEDQS